MIASQTPRPRPPIAQNGFIVVAVLWIIGALATLAMIYAAYVANAASSISVGDDRLQSEALMTAALELTAFQLTAAKGETVPTHGQFNFRADRASVSAHFASESARIDLNKAPKELLAGLFGVLGADPAQAKDYAGNVLAWRTPPRSQSTDDETSRYRAAGLNYAPRGGPFAHVDELWLVRGLPLELVERTIPYVTVYSGIAGINALEAAPEVIAALPGMTRDTLNAVLRQRQTAPQDARSVSTLLPAQAGASAEASKAARINVRIDFENGRRVASEAVIVVSDDADTPYRILSWHDGFDDPAPGKQPTTMRQ
jgi:general secretion pathway protein K